MNWVLIGAIFLIGSAVGSFVNVLVSRSVEGKNWVTGRSVCDYCRRQLSWYDNIPLLSFAIYRGKSRCCGKSLSWKHPLIEGLFGALFVWWLLAGFWFFKLAIAPLSYVQPVFWLVLGVILFILAVADAYYGVILMGVLYFGVAWLYLYRLILYFSGVYRGVDLINSLVAGMLGFGMLWFLRYITKGRGMGDGDPYLAFLTCSILGWSKWGVGMLSSFITGAIVGVILLLIKNKKWKDTLPFGPFLILGAIIGIWFGENLNKLLFGY